MDSRKNLRQKNKRNNLYLIIGAVVLVIAIAAGFMIHSEHVKGEARARTFATTHFNPNVKIYGIDVGNLTVAKATEKINKKATNVIHLKDDKVVAERDPEITTISKDQVQKYFNKQHTDIPNNKKYNYTSKEYDEAKEKLTKIHNASVTYKIDGKEYNLKAKDLITEANYKNGKYQFIDVKNLTKKLNDINKEVSTLHKSYKVQVPSGNSVKGKTITVKNESYGWGVYVKKAQAAVEKAFMDGDKTLDGSKYLYGDGFSTYEHGYGKSNHGLGENYAVVSIKNQELWVVRKGKVAAHLNDVVTGTNSGDNKTPVGVWYVMYKESPSTLRGFNDDGSRYSSPVQYWMPFTLSGCGFHDASWRTNWSKSAYLAGGSHGCVNIRPSEIHSVWSNIIKDEPVIIY
ncbi:L,D-transpeptidase family protein [Lactobacillus sp. PSON]|uniref:L,D-transpeptidase family protein n=1 Tax=Lactobacillus sp. PSON TaxID=3455454 RepID=UPI004042BD85